MSPAQHLAGRVAVVTGGGRGIGRAHAVRLASHGAAVLVNDLGVSITGDGEDPSPAAEVAACIRDAGGRAVANHDDVSSFAGAARIVDHALEQFDRVDIVVNNAGIVGDAPIDEITEETLTRLLAVHYVGAVGICRAAVPHMRRQGHGRIVNTVSEAALDTRFPGGIAYGGAKAAVWAATLAMARQLDGTGITVNALSPGARTRMNDALFAEREAALDLDPDHVARVVAAIVSDDAGHINGCVVHTAAGFVREYRVSRLAESPVTTFLTDAMARLVG
jgi:NAD(P)-dependent dehydrogenase (short-subunit alcohol dehydrogenase family)